MCIFTGFKEWHDLCFPCVSGLLPSDMSTQLALLKHLHSHMLGPEAQKCQHLFDIVLCYDVNSKCFTSILWPNHLFLLKNGHIFNKGFCLFCHVDRDVKQYQGSDFLLSIKHNKAKSQSCFQGLNLVSHRFLLGSFVFSWWCCEAFPLSYISFFISISIQWLPFAGVFFFVSFALIKSIWGFFLADCCLESIELKYYMPV